MFIFLPILSIMILVMYLSTMSFQLNSGVCMVGMCFDEVSLFMVYMACFVIFISFFFCLSFVSVKLNLSLVSMLMVCVFLFLASNMFLLYLFYEVSLIPILYIIMKWGSYPERSISSIMLLTYTSIFTFPFIYVLFCFFNTWNSLCFYTVYSYSSMSVFFSLIIFFTFAVKLPIYGLHFWLPMAHVEAPTFGSMILAGVLLKLGGVGLLRFSLLMDLENIKQLLYGYFVVFLVYTTMVCCFQSDFKRLVAYSSVSHMMSVPIMLFSSCFVSFKGILVVMFLHGISSPLLFMLVGVIYSFTSTRQHIMMRGLLCANPLLSFICVLSFFFTLSAPPYPSFISEVFFVLSSLVVWKNSIYFLIVFLFLSIVYNLLWLTSTNFLMQDASFSFSFSFSFSSFLPVFLSLFIIPIVFSSMFYAVF